MTNIFKCDQCGETTVHICATCADQQQYELSLLKKQRDDLLLRVAGLLEQTKRLQCQLAGCGVAAMQNTRASAAQRSKPGDYGYSPSYGEVCLMADREMAMREQRDELLATLKQAHRFLRKNGYDMTDIDATIAKAEDAV